MVLATVVGKEKKLDTPSSPMITTLIVEKNGKSIIEPYSLIFMFLTENAMSLNNFNTSFIAMREAIFQTYHCHKANFHQILNVIICSYLKLCLFYFEQLPLVSE